MFRLQSLSHCWEPTEDVHKQPMHGTQLQVPNSSNRIATVHKSVIKSGHLTLKMVDIFIPTVVPIERKSGWNHLHKQPWMISEFYLPYNFEDSEVVGKYMKIHHPWLQIGHSSHHRFQKTFPRWVLLNYKTHGCCLFKHLQNKSPFIFWSLNPTVHHQEELLMKNTENRSLEVLALGHLKAETRQWNEVQS